METESLFRTKGKTMETTNRLWENMGNEIKEICDKASYYLTEEELSSLQSQLLDNAQIELEKMTRHNAHRMRKLVVGE